MQPHCFHSQLEKARSKTIISINRYLRLWCSTWCIQNSCNLLINLTGINVIVMYVTRLECHAEAEVLWQCMEHGCKMERARTWNAEESCSSTSWLQTLQSSDQRKCEDPNQMGRRPSDCSLLPSICHLQISLGWIHGHLLPRFQDHGEWRLQGETASHLLGMWYLLAP